MSGFKELSAIKDDSDSEDEARYTQNGAFKEYEFEPTGDVNIENKISEFWKLIEIENIKPVKTKKAGLKFKKGTAQEEMDGEDVVVTQDECKEQVEGSWLETLQLLQRRGLEKAAKNATKVQFCKLCSNDDLGKVYADEDYEDEFVKKMKPEFCD